MTTPRRTDPVKVWFFVVLGALIPATSLFIWVLMEKNKAGF